MADERLTTDDRPRRPALATIAGVLHVVMGLGCVGIVVYLLYLTRSPEILKEEDAAEAVHGLKLAAGIIAPVGIVYLAGGIGVWKGRIWGWVISAAMDVLALSFMLWDAVSMAPHYTDWDEVIIAAVFFVLLILLLLPSVRRWCWRRKARAQPATA